MMTGFHNYRARPTRNLLNVGMNSLSNLVVRPGIRKFMWPICLYRGQMTPGHAHRLWNYALLMMAAEAETLADGLSLAHNPAFAQLCGPVNRPQKQTLFSFFGRLWDNPDVTDNIPGLTEYVRFLDLGPSWLKPVSLETAQQYCAPWRVSTHPDFDRRTERPESGAKPLYYPYLAHDPKKKSNGEDLVLLANKLVPETLPHDIRADVCQELIVSILSGQISRDQAHDHVQKHIGKVFKSVEFKWTPAGLKFSMDAKIRGYDEDDDRSLHDVISDGLYQHWSDQMEEADAPERW